MAEEWDDLDPVDDLIMLIARDMNCVQLSQKWITTLQDNLYRDIGELKFIAMDEIEGLELPAELYIKIKEALRMPVEDPMEDAMTLGAPVVVQAGDVDNPETFMSVVHSVPGASKGGSIFECASSGDVHGVLSALRSTASVHDMSELTWTPLHFAAFFGQETVAITLLEHGANVNAEDRSMSTPLHCAAIGGHDKLAELLLRSGANPDVPNKCKKTPLQVAVSTNKPLVAAVIRRATGATEAEQHMATSMDMQV